MTGCDNTTVNGTIVSTAVAATAKTALIATYDDAMNRTLNKCTLASSDLTAAQGVCGGVTSGFDMALCLANDCTSK